MLLKVTVNSGEALPVESIPHESNPATEAFTSQLAAFNPETVSCEEEAMVVLKVVVVALVEKRLPAVRAVEEAKLMKEAAAPETFKTLAMVVEPLSESAVPVALVKNKFPAVKAVDDA